MTGYAVVSLLHDKFTDAWPERQAFYGPPADSEWTGSEPATWVAHSETDAAAVTIEAVPAQEDGSQQLSVTVQCAAGIYVGGEDVKDVLRQLDEHVQGLRRAVMFDRTLGGRVINAEFGATQGVEFSRDGGVRILSLFSVQVTAWSS